MLPALQVRRPKQKGTNRVKEGSNGYSRTQQEKKIRQQKNTTPSTTAIKEEAPMRNVPVNFVDAGLPDNESFHEGIGSYLEHISNELEDGDCGSIELRSASDRAGLSLLLGYIKGILEDSPEVQAELLLIKAEVLLENRQDGTEELNSRQTLVLLHQLTSEPTLAEASVAG